MVVLLLDGPVSWIDAGGVTKVWLFASVKDNAVR